MVGFDSGKWPIVAPWKGWRASVMASFQDLGTSDGLVSTNEWNVCIFDGPDSTWEGQWGINEGQWGVYEGPASILQEPVNILEGPLSILEGPLSILEGPLSIQK